MEIFLASAVIAALITSLFTYFQNQKSSNLQYITDERRKWRESVRDIYESLSNSHCYSDVVILLAKLKTRINPYGRYSGKYVDDSHIWDAIRKLEHSELDFEKNKVLLLDYLSLLLKGDWDRSKQEIKGNWTRIRAAFIYALTLPLYWFVILVLWGKPFGIMSLLIFLLVLLSYFVVPNLDTITNSSQSNFSRKEFWGKTFCQSIIYYVILILGLIKAGQGVGLENLICGIILICVWIGLIFLFDYQRTYNECFDERRYNAAISDAKSHHDQ